MPNSAPGQTGAPASDALLQVGQKVGNYRVIRQLGQGGMGTVFEALHQYIERRAAIKVLHPDLSQNPQFASRFLNEARAVNLIQHPGLVEIFEFGILDNGTAFIIMEFLAGEELSQRMRRTPESGPQDAFIIGRQIAQAMAAVHAKGIVHRDLKPQNVMVLPDSTQAHGLRVKILDFGIAKLASGPDGKVRTETGAMIGTPAYMSPEQCLGAGTVDGKADVYALGVILYEMLACRLPFERQHSFDFMAAHVRDAPQPLHTVVLDMPQEIEDLVHSMLAKDPADRPSMEAVVALLGEAQALAPDTWAQQAPGRARRPSRELMAIEATVSGQAQTPRASGQISGGARASGRRDKEVIELDHTVPGAKSMERRLSREGIAVSPLLPGTTPLPLSSTPLPSQPRPEGQSRETLAPASQSGTAPTLARTRPVQVVGIVAAFLIITIAGIALTRRAASPPQPARVSDPATAPVRMVRWSVVSTPPGAEVRSDGKILGNTPWEIERPAGSGETALTLSYDGYQSKTIVLNHSTEVKTEVRLSPVAPPPTSAGEPATPAPRKPGKGKSATGGKARKEPKDGDVKLLID